MDKEREDHLKEEYKKRLKKIISRKFDTTMISALCSFESFFGYLWGHGLDDSMLTEEQKKIKEQWVLCRENVLNSGNKQKRNALTEINMHDVEWKRYTKVFTPKGN